MGDVVNESKLLLVRRWGEMGGYWGINRTMAEIHALLFVSGQPLCTDDVMRHLHVSRGNASMNLRALVDWGLIQRMHKLGDRKEYFQADADVWHMFETIMRERRRREVEPIIATIDRCREMVAELDGGNEAEAAETRAYRRRLSDLQDFLTTMGALFELVLHYGSDGVGRLAQFLRQAASQPGDETPTPPGSDPRPRRATPSRTRSHGATARKTRK